MNFLFLLKTNLKFYDYILWAEIHVLCGDIENDLSYTTLDKLSTSDKTSRRSDARARKNLNFRC